MATALELGLATIRSRLGDPLVVEIPYRLAAGEALVPSCVGLVPAAQTAGGLPRYADVSRIAITPTHIEIFGQSRVLEPLIGVTVGVQCPSVPRFVRSYELFVDPPSYVPASQRSGTAVASAATLPRATPAAEPAAPATAIAVAPSAPRVEASPRARGQSGGALTQGETYVVVRGDTLSGIAARVADRPGTIRATADAIFAANAEAFARGNPDLLQAGRSITIPMLAGAAPVPPAAREPMAEPIVVQAAPVATAPQVEAERQLEPQPLPVDDSAAPRVDPVTSQVAEPIELEPVAVAPSAEPNVAPALVAETPASAAASALPATPRASLWLTIVLSLGGAIVLSIPISFLRRRREEAPRPAPVKPRATPRRRFVDPTAGIDVVEGELPRALAVTRSEPPQRTLHRDAHAVAAPDFDTGSERPAETVDLDVGMPTPAAESGDRTATLRMQGVDAATVEVAEANVDDERHTLTIAELDLLRADYESEHTLTQEASKTLRDALADLKATEAAHAAGDDTATLEVLESEASETQPTRRLRAAR